MSGPYISESGDVISSALSVSDVPQAADELTANFRLEMGQIDRIYTVDDKENTVNGIAAVHTVYDVLVVRPNGATELIPRCRMLQPGFGGGVCNFLEILPTDPGTQAKDPKVERSLKRGHFVLVGFISGKKDAAVILGAMPHSNRVAVGRRPKKGKGTYLEGEIQGLNFTVDNDGGLRITFNGPRKDDGTLVNQNGPTEIQIDKQGSITVKTNQKQTVFVDRVKKKIRVDNGPTSIDMDQDAKKIQVVAQIVEVGTGGLQPMVVGDDWKKIMEELITEITKLYVPTGVGPSGTPVNTPAFNSIKSKLKEALSKNHKVEK